MVDAILLKGESELKTALGIRIPLFSQQLIDANRTLTGITEFASDEYYVITRRLCRVTEA